jgi:hypothetical protein
MAANNGALAQRLDDLSRPGLTPDTPRSYGRVRFVTLFNPEGLFSWGF